MWARTVALLLVGSAAAAACTETIIVTQVVGSDGGVEAGAARDDGGSDAAQPVADAGPDVAACDPGPTQDASYRVSDDWVYIGKSCPAASCLKGHLVYRRQSGTSGDRPAIDGCHESPSLDAGSGGGLVCCPAKCRKPVWPTNGCPIIVGKQTTEYMCPNDGDASVVMPEGESACTLHKARGYDNEMLVCCSL